jgi:hypothetical protein
MKRALLASVLVILVTTAAISWRWRHSAQQTPSPTGTVHVATCVSGTSGCARANAVRQVKKPSSGGAARAVPPPERKADYREELKTSADYWALAHEMLRRANAGDAQAEYMLWRIATRECRNGYSGYVYDERAKRARTLDETLLEVRKHASANFPPDTAAIEQYWHRCHEFYSQDVKGALGDPWQWLARASDGGDVLAQATTAHEKVEKAMDEARVKAGVSSYILQNDRDRATLGDGEPRELVSAALRSAPSDPEVLESVADMQGLINPEVLPKDRRELKMAWTYLACQHGASCEYWGDPVPLPCSPSAQCTFVPAKMLQQVNNDWAPISQRVDEINNALTKGLWDQVPGL